MEGIYVGTPAYGGLVSTQYLASIVKLTRACDARGIRLELGILGSESLIQRARNRIVGRFLKSECSHLLFIDADIGFDWRAVFAMGAAQVDLVGGVYPMKTLNWKRAAHVSQTFAESAPYPVIEEKLQEAAAEMCWNPRLDEKGQLEARSNGPHTIVRAHDVPTGFMMLSRAGIEKMIAAYPETEYRDDVLNEGGKVAHALFDCFIDEDGRYLSEDYGYCRRWQRIGGTCWVYIGAKLTHVGSYQYTGSLADRFTDVDDRPSTTDETPSPPPHGDAAPAAPPPIPLNLPWEEAGG